MILSRICWCTLHPIKRLFLILEKRLRSHAFPSFVLQANKVIDPGVGFNTSVHTTSMRARSGTTLLGRGIGR